MKNICIYFALAFCLSCNKKQDITKKELAQPYKSSITVETLLNLFLDASGHDRLFNATLTFERKGFNYSAMRKGHIYEYRLSQTKNGIDYLAISGNGKFQYTENGEPVSYGIQNRLLEQKLIFDNNIMVVPRLFQDDNSVNVKLGRQVQVKKIDYRVLQVEFKAQMPTDKMRNIRIYINPKSFLPDYICYGYGSNTRLLWLEFTKRHNLDGIIISDFQTYTSDNLEASHEDMVRSFNAGSLKKYESIRYNDLELIEN